MGLKDWLDRKRRGYTDLDELMNPMVAWRMKQFVVIHPSGDDRWLRHYFQFLDKNSTRLEFIVFYAQTAGGWSYEATAYRKLGEDAYSLLSERGPWSTTISALLDMGQHLPASTHSSEGHHAAGVSIERKAPPPKPEPPKPAPRPAPTLIKAEPPEPKFHVGEYVVYPHHGVGKIVEIKPDLVNDEMIRVLVIHFKNDNVTLRVPTGNAKKLGLRKLEDEL